MTDSISFDLQDSVAVLRMDDGKVNALTPAVVEALTEYLPRAIADAKALVIIGRAGCFSAGFDLKVLMSGPEAATGLLLAGSELYMRLYEHPQPVVAAVTGHAIAGGALLSASCDVRIGVRGAFKLGLNEVQVGMPVPILAHALARDRLDPRRLSEAVLFATMYTPEEAIDVGWLDRLTDVEQLEEEALGVARELSQLAPAAYARTKASLRRMTIDHIRGTVVADIESFTRG